MPKTLSGCHYSTPSVYPSNWETCPKSSLKFDWHINYYFFDENFKDKYPNGKPVRLKSGINYEKTLELRRAAVRMVLEAEILRLEFQDYNPITKRQKPPQIVNDDACKVIHSGMRFLEALTAARNVKICEQTTKIDLDSVIRWTSTAAIQLGFDALKISEISRKHVKMLLDELSKIKKEKWTNNNFNHYRAHLGMLWNELIEYEAAEYNVVEKIKKRPTTKKIKKTLSDPERTMIDQTLRKNDYRFWLLMHIFFHSGCRRGEILSLKAKDVDLVKQEYRVLNKKGGVYKEVIRPIKNIAVEYWQQALVHCRPDQVIFSVGLAPGNCTIRPEQLTRRWQKQVKDPETGLGIDVNFYLLKHLNTDEVTEQLDINAAARLNTHSPAVAAKHYALGENQRQMDRIKKVNNSFNKQSQFSLDSLTENKNRTLPSPDAPLVADR